MLMRFSYKALRKAIEEHVIPYHDAVIEGGIGNNFDRYIYFRGLGYDKLYIGVDLLDPEKPMPNGLTHREGVCFDSEFIASVLDEYEIKNPVFVTNAGALTEALISETVFDGYYYTHLDEAIGVLTKLFRKQLHIRPAGNFPVTYNTVSYPEGTGSKEYQRFMKFLDESAKLGWKYDIMGRNIVLLWR
jgi:hypothetical protein